MKESPIIEEVDQPRENRYWCPKCKAHKKPIVKVMKNYHSGDNGPTDKVIQKCSCGFREMYVPIECREDGERFRKLAAYLLGISCVILTIDFLFFDFSSSDLKGWAVVTAGLSIWSFLYTLTRYIKWKHWREAYPIVGIVKNNNANMAALTVGMTKAQALETMGPAAKMEVHKTKSGGGMEFLFYRTEAAKPDYLLQGEWGNVTDRHWTPICIIDGKLEGWGRNFYDDTIEIRKEVIKK